jgi:3-oxoacyl-[acyl-carrier-protein] synthase-3
MYRFLHYHGMNDEHHLARWLVAVELALDCDETGRAEQIIIETARRTAALYLMQFQYAKEF